MFGFLQLIVVSVISYAAFALGVWALIDVARRAPERLRERGQADQGLVARHPGRRDRDPLHLPAVPVRQWSVEHRSTHRGSAAAAAVIVYHVGVKPALGAHRKGPKGGGRNNNKGGW